MAEFVQQSIEEMLPELEQMERVGLFTASEIRTILRKRRAYEYKLRRRTKHKEDFLQYIQYEMSVLSLVRKRRENIGYKFKRIEIDIAIVKRIHQLFKLACSRFQDDTKLWLSHIEFCKQRKEKASVTRLLTRMLQIHNKQPALWVNAAAWEMEAQMSMNNARSLLQRGLRFNPTSKHLWIEYFRMELLNADKLRKRKEVLGLSDMDADDLGLSETMSTAVMQGQVAVVVCTNAMEAFPGDIEIRRAFVAICRLFDFTASIEDLIYDELEKQHGDSELTWDTIAGRHLQRAAQVGKQEELDKKQKAAERERLEAEVYKVFNTAVTTLNTELMWTFYLKACLESLKLKKTDKFVAAKRVSQVLAVFHRAHEAQRLAPEMALQWLTMLQKTGQVEELVRVSRLLLEDQPGSAALWARRLTVIMESGAASHEVFKELQTALMVVNEKDSLDLWKTGLEWSVINCPDKVQQMFEEGVHKCAEVGAAIKVYYLQWAALYHDVHMVRNLYKTLSASQPLTLELFKQYIEIENSQAKPKIKRVRRAYEDAVREFGSSNTELWLEYIQMELSHPKGQPEHAGQLHWQAMKALDGHLTERFITQYTLLQTGHLG